MDNLQHTDGRLSLTQSLENEALEKADSAISLLEQLENIISNLEAICKSIPRDICQDLQTEIDKMKSILALIDVRDSPVDLLNLKALPKSKIARMGINREVIDMHLQGISDSEIAKTFGLSTITISNFIKVYTSAIPSQQENIRNWSVFDTAGRLEEMGALIYNQLARLGADPNTQNKFVESQLKVIDQAQKFAQNWEGRKTVQQIQTMVQEIFMDELSSHPELRQRVFDRFNTLGIQKALR